MEKERRAYVHLKSQMLMMSEEKVGQNRCNRRVPTYTIHLIKHFTIAKEMSLSSSNCIKSSKIGFEKLKFSVSFCDVRESKTYTVLKGYIFVKKLTTSKETKYKPETSIVFS